MEFCYSFIEPKRIYTSDYDDEVHICLDLMDAYGTICKKIIEDNYEQCASAKADIDYILEKKYADTPYGGMNNIRNSTLKVHDCIERIQLAIPDCTQYFDKYEVYYKKLGF